MRVVRSTNKFPIRMILIVVLAAVALAACAGGASTVLAPVGDSVDGGSGRGLAEAPAGGEVGDSEDGFAAPGASAAPVPEDGLGAADDAKIIRTGTMDLEVDNVPTAVRVARDAIRGFGGYIGASQTYNQDDQPYAEITYRIPVTRWEDALDALRSLTGVSTKVVSEQTQAVDVTGQVADLAARIRNLRASEVSLLAIAEKATRITDILEVQARLTEIRGQIEQLEAQQTDLGDRTAYATLAVSYRLPVVAAIETQAKGWDPGAIFDEASASLVGVLQGLAGAGIWFLIVWLPVILLVSIVLGFMVWLLRRLGVLDRAMRPTPPVVTGD
jgi:hypothetical protein